MEAVDAPPPISDPEADEQSAPRALLIEDSATVRLLHSALLTDAGFVIDAVADGQEGLALANTRSYRLIVAGQETRGLRGPDLIAAVRTSVGGEERPCIVTQSDESPLTETGLPSISYVTVAAPRAERLTALARDLVAG